MTTEALAPAATLTSRIDAGRLVVALGGAWTADTASAAEAGTTKLKAESGTPQAVLMDFSDVTRLDTLGGTLAYGIEKAFADKGVSVERTGLSEAAAVIYGEVVTGLSAPLEPVPPRVPVLRMALEKVGTETISAIDDLKALLDVLGKVVVALGKVVTLSSPFRFAAVITQLDRMAFRATPIIALITFLIGAIICQQGFFFFRKFGADTYVVDLVSVLTLREIGVLIVSIMVAGRTGSAFTAEIGSMKMREEIDALQVMGLNPIEVLVLPRLIALMIGLPLLTIIGDLSALAGGAVVAQVYGGLSIESFLQRFQDEVSTRHIWIGLAKAPFMALIIGLVACVEGLRVKGSAESLGAQTTASVVKAIFLVIVVDGLFAIFYAAIGQ
ncbi:MlaE family ABC transporter permease [Phreatobacter aquaticus]|uniref:MlaE family ABC transporter permease n=1 Tax=Phreatobacter aquaticus TaxID=2570229 RepID=UPI00208E0E20|nr:ABC transporter permease [Phreatobacter aquaticus]